MKRLLKICCGMFKITVDFFRRRLEFTLSSDQAYEVEEETGTVVIRVDYENQQIGRAHV